jgi:hypothetical protein
MSLLFPTAALSSLPLSVHLLAPPAMPSLLSDCFPCAFVYLGKYVLYSSASSWQACWHTSHLHWQRIQNITSFVCAVGVFLKQNLPSFVKSLIVIQKGYDWAMLM